MLIVPVYSISVHRKRRPLCDFIDLKIVITYKYGGSSVNKMMNVLLVEILASRTPFNLARL